MYTKGVYIYKLCGNLKRRREQTREPLNDNLDSS